MNDMVYDSITHIRLDIEDRAIQSPPLSLKKNNNIYF